MLQSAASLTTVSSQNSSLSVAKFSDPKIASQLGRRRQWGELGDVETIATCNGWRACACFSVWPIHFKRPGPLARVAGAPPSL